MISQGSILPTLRRHYFGNNPFSYSLNGGLEGGRATLAPVGFEHFVKDSLDFGSPLVDGLVLSFRPADRPHETLMIELLMKEMAHRSAPQLEVVDPGSSAGMRRTLFLWFSSSVEF